MYVNRYKLYGGNRRYILYLHSRESFTYSFGFGFGDEEVYFYKFQSTAKTGWYKSYITQGDTCCKMLSICFTFVWLAWQSSRL